LGDIVTRGRKLFTVGAILAIGLILAWPFRKEGTHIEQVPPVASPPTDVLRASNGDPIAALQDESPNAVMLAAPTQALAQTVGTSLTETIEKAPGPLGSFDIANHPALVQAAGVPIADSVTLPSNTLPPTAEPTYSSIQKTPSVSIQDWPAELVHVVANGDTLEKLAKRYLNDAGRALEIFDLNRDQLSNPHLLPIGVELRVPQNPNRIID
jgi:nucleoid-associated protein YgaU